MTHIPAFDSWVEARDRMRLHEEAHKAAAGDIAIGDIEYKWEGTPNGLFSILHGSLQLEVGINPAQPEASLHKMHAIARIALAPAKPSKHDHLIAKTARYVSREIRKGIFPRFTEVFREYKDCYACAARHSDTFCVGDDERQVRRDEGNPCAQYDVEKAL